MLKSLFTFQIIEYIFTCEKYVDIEEKYNYKNGKRIFGVYFCLFSLYILNQKSKDKIWSKSITTHIIYSIS